LEVWVKQAWTTRTTWSDGLTAASRKDVYPHPPYKQKKAPGNLKGLNTKDQFVDVAFPTAALYLPAVQTEQRVAPSTVETRPASQAVQLGADAAEYWPLVHWAQLVAATSLYLPATQSLHEVWACKFWNWPMPQLRQSVAPVEVP
jgi:hypothetical protein